MKAIFLVIILTAISALAFAASVDDGITGKWTLTVAAPGEAVEVLLDLKLDGDKVTGTMSSSVGGGTITNGTFKDKKLTATINADVQGSPTELGVVGTVDGDKISGSITAHGLGSFTYAGTRAK